MGPPTRSDRRVPPLTDGQGHGTPTVRLGVRHKRLQHKLKCANLEANAVKRCVPTVLSAGVQGTHRVWNPLSLPGPGEGVGLELGLGGAPLSGPYTPTLRGTLVSCRCKPLWFQTHHSVEGSVAWRTTTSETCGPTCADSRTVDRGSLVGPVDGTDRETPEFHRRQDQVYTERCLSVHRPGHTPARPTDSCGRNRSLNPRLPPECDWFARGTLERLEGEGVDFYYYFHE